MSQRLDLRLQCPKCGTIYLRIPDDVRGSTMIRCFVCGRMLGTWDEMRDDFIAWGGNDGVFEMRDGQFIRKG
jgi:hypothetical protein